MEHKSILVVPQDPEEFRRVDGSIVRQQNNTQSQESFQQLHQHVASSGLQHSKPEYATSQCSSGNRNSGSNSVYNSGQHNGNLFRLSNLNSNSPHQRQHLNAISSVDTTSLKQKTDNVGVPAHTCPLQNLCSSPFPTSTPLLHALLTGNHSDVYETQCSSSNKTNVSIDCSTSTDLSCKRQCKNQQVKCSIDALSCEQIMPCEQIMARMQNPGHLRTHAKQQQVSFHKPVQQSKPPTDDEILDLITKEIENYKRGFSLKRNRDARYSKKSAYDKATQDIQKQSVCSAKLDPAVGHALDNSQSSKENDEFTQTGEYQTVISAKHSAEYSAIMRNIPGICSEKEEERSVVLLSTPGMILDDIAKEVASYKSPEEHICPGLSLKHLNGTNKVCSLALKHMPVKENEDLCLKPVDSENCAVGFDKGHGDVSLNIHSMPSSVVTRNKKVVPTSFSANSKNRKKPEDHGHIKDQEIIARSMITSSFDQIQINNVISISTDHSKKLWDVLSGKGLKNAVLCASNLSTVQPPLSPRIKGEKAQSVKIIENLQYGSTDSEELSLVLSNVTKTEHEELSYLLWPKNPLYEDVSEDENSQVENLAVETLLQEANNKNLTLENEDHGDEAIIKQVSLEIDTLQTPQQPSFLHSGETGDGFQHHLDHKCVVRKPPEWKKESPVSQSPSSHLNNLYLVTDNVVKRLTKSDLKYEGHVEVLDAHKSSMEDDQESHVRGRQDAKSPVKSISISASYQIEVFDTVTSFIQAKTAHIGNSFEVASDRRTSVHDKDSDIEGEQHTPQDKRESYSEPEDSSETEDSCDYSSGLEHNFLTVSGYFLKKNSAPERDDEKRKEKCDEDKAANVQNVQSKNSDKFGCMQKLKKPIKAKARSKHPQRKINRQKSSANQDIVYVDSDTENESDRNCKKKTKKVRSFSHGLSNTGYALLGQPTLVAVDTHCKAGKAMGESPAPLQQLKDYQRTKVMKDIFSELSHSAETGGKPTETKASPELVKNTANKRIIINETAVVIDSDTEDDGDENPEVESRTNMCLSSSSNLMSWSNLQSLQVEKVKQDASSDLSFLISRGRQPKMSTEECFRHFHIDMKRQTTKNGSITPGPDKMTGKMAQMSKKNGPTERTFSSVSTESSITQTRQSSKTANSLCISDIQTKDKRSTSGSKPVIPLLYFKKSRFSNCLKLFEESQAQRQRKQEKQTSETSTTTSKNMKYGEMNTRSLHLNKARAAVTEPSLVSGQLSLPNQCPSTFSSAHTRSLSESKEIRVTSNYAKIMQRTPVSYLSSSKFQSHSRSPTSTLDHPNSPTKCQRSNAIMQQVKYTWDRRKMEEQASRTTRNESRREVRPGPSHRESGPRRRHKFKDTATSLMKRSKIEAIKWRKAIHRHSPREQRCYSGEGYKWSEKPKMSRHLKDDTSHPSYGSSKRRRYSSPERSYE